MNAKPWLLSLILLLSLTAQAEDWTTLNLRVLDQHLLPRYEALAHSTAELDKAAQNFCQASPDQSDLQSHLQNLQQHYHKAMDDWMAIQHMRFGPAELYLRYSRLQLWPDKRGSTAKQLRALLAEANPAILTEAEFQHQSVAVQGFNALEMLLFEAVPLSEFGSQDQASFRCQLVEAISANLAEIGRGIVTDWREAPMQFRQLFASAEDGNAYFESSLEISSKLLNNLNTGVQAMVEVKLMRPLEPFRPRRSESWRSERSLRNLQYNLIGLQELYQVGFAPLVNDERLKREIDNIFQRPLITLSEIKQPWINIEEGSAEHDQLKWLLAEVQQLQYLIGELLPGDIGLSLGFNSLDGD